MESTVSAAREELMRLVEDLRKGQEIHEQRLFSHLGDIVGDLGPHRDLWLEKVFAPAKSENGFSFLFDHSINVGILAMLLGHEVSVKSHDLLILGAGALLHDVGMFELPHEILDARRPLTERERKIVETHPVTGAKMLEDSRLEKVFSKLALQEQERQNGSGYPHGLKGTEIEYFAKIIGFCDSIESITHFRPYRTQKSFLDGFSLLLKDGRDLFPRHLWIAALRRITPYPPGTLVRLSTGKVARVSRPNPEFPMKPVVETLEHEDADVGEHILDLRRHPMITIQEAIT